MKFKPKFFIVIPHSSINNLVWECTTHYPCMAHIPHMLRELLNVKTIGREIKWIVNQEHRLSVMKKYNVSWEDIDDYLRADASMISFSAKRTRDRAIKELKRLDIGKIYACDSYRDMLLKQAELGK